MSISKKRRFEIFKRDGFACQYCGKSPPDTLLEVDHINPKSKGGDDDFNNLITACMECNRGKSDRELDQIPSSLSENIKVLKEKELQIKEYNKVLKQIRQREDKNINEIVTIYQSYYPKWTVTEQFRERKIRIFVKSLPLNEVIEAMHSACSKMDNKEDAILYFCGICWRKIKKDRHWLR